MLDYTQAPAAGKEVLAIAGRASYDTESFWRVRAGGWVGPARPGLAASAAAEEPVMSEIEAVWGRLLFDLVALANLKGVDAESVLRKAVRDFEKGLQQT